MMVGMKFFFVKNGWLLFDDGWYVNLVVFIGIVGYIVVGLIYFVIVFMDDFVEIIEGMVWIIVCY